MKKISELLNENGLDADITYDKESVVIRDEEGNVFVEPLNKEPIPQEIKINIENGPKAN